MAIKILLDRSHLEELYDLPRAFDSYDYLFFHAEENLLNYDLSEYDVVILGNPCAYVTNKLQQSGQFLAEELNNLVQYIKDGGSVFITWGPPLEENPYRVPAIKYFSKLIGLRHIFEGYLFSADTPDKGTRIVINAEKSHPIFQKTEEFTVDHASLFLPSAKTKILASSPSECNYLFKPSKIKRNIKSGPILVERRYFQGKILSCSSTKMFTNISKSDQSFDMNRKFFHSIVEYLAPKQDPFEEF